MYECVPFICHRMPLSDVLSSAKRSAWLGMDSVGGGVGVGGVVCGSSGGGGKG